MEEDRLEVDIGLAAELEEKDAESKPEPVLKQPKKRFVGRRTAVTAAAAGSISSPSATEEIGAIQIYKPRRTPRLLNQVPRELLNDPSLIQAISLLPPNYSFELPKTIHRIRTLPAKKVALQLPEGLLLFATTISDIITQFCPGSETLIMGDVTYGACCVDDYTARALGCDLLVHYAHSCLVPVDVTRIKTLYVFVDVAIDTSHLLATMERNFAAPKRIAMVGTIQFNATIHGVKPVLERAGFEIVVPQIAPLSKGEILGCTSPELPRRRKQPPGQGTGEATVEEIDTNGIDLILYLGDGRFHLESIMIQNPTIPAYRYDPYSRRLTHETYSHTTLHDLRRTAVLTARSSRGKWGLILGSLGRQGNPHVISLIETELRERGIPFVNVLMSEIFPGKLELMEKEVECWVQVACPRLSIDWGYAFSRPLLTPYEALVALGVREGTWADEDGGKDRGTEGDGSVVYPMDYYGKEGLGRTRAGDIGCAR